MTSPITERPRRRWWVDLLIRVTRFTVVVYVGVLVMLLFMEDSMLYQPSPASAVWWKAPPDARAEDVERQLADGTPLHGWWCPTPGWEPSQGALLFCHGNAGNLSHWGPNILTWQQQMKLAVLIFDYPGYGRSGGRPSETGCYAAADAYCDWLVEQKKVAPEGIVLYGISMGGGVAVDVGSRRPHRGLVLVCPFSSIPDLAQWSYPVLPGRWLARNRFDNLAKIGRCRSPVFLAHGTADHVVPFWMGERLFAAANEPKAFFAMDGFDHQAPPPAFYEQVRAFLETE